MPPEIWRRRLEKLKDMGVNSVRCSHNPPDEALLDLCDELGFYVMDEAFDEWRLMKAKEIDQILMKVMDILCILMHVMNGI